VVEQQGPFAHARALDIQINGVLSHIDVDVLSQQERKALHTMKRLAADARLDARDYEYADTRAEQLRYAAVGKKRLEQLQRTILAASEQNVFTAIEVAELSVVVQQIIVGLE
jgi:hypothetical protein